MWKCKNCSEQLEDDFDSCWNCGYSRDGIAPDGSAKEAVKGNKKEAAKQAASGTYSPLPKRQEVVVVDVSVPFVSMVVLMVKWAIASIPAFLILIVFGSFFVGLLGGIGASIFH